MLGLKMINEPKLTYSVRSQNTGFPWEVGTRKGALGLENVLFLDPDAGCLDVFNL